MAFFSQIADDHGTDNALSVHYSSGNPALTIPVDRVDYLRMQGVNFLRTEACPARAQIYDWQYLRGGQLEVLGRRHPLGEGVRQLHLMIDQFLISSTAMNPQSLPELE